MPHNPRLRAMSREERERQMGGGGMGGASGSGMSSLGLAGDDLLEGEGVDSSSSVEGTGTSIQGHSYADVLGSYLYPFLYFYAFNYAVY